MKISPIINFSSNSKLNKNNQNLKNNNVYMSNELAADTVQFKGIQSFNSVNVVKIGEALNDTLRPFMAETRPVYMKLLGARKALTGMNKTIREFGACPFKPIAKINDDQAKALIKKTDEMLDKLLYKQTTVLASESDAHLKHINESRMLDFTTDEISALDLKTNRIFEDMTALKEKMKTLPVVKEEANAFLDNNKSLLANLFV